jgi:hypothetical protein
MNEFIRKMGRKEGEVRVIKECPDSRNKVRERGWEEGRKRTFFCCFLQMRREFLDF